MTPTVINFLISLTFKPELGMFLTPKYEQECRIFYKIKRKEVVYINEGEKYIAKIELGCMFKEKKDKEIIDVWIIKDTVWNYEETTNESEIVGKVRIILPPGEYTYKVTLKDLNSNRKTCSIGKIKVKELEKKPYLISGVQKYRKRDTIFLKFEVYNFCKKIDTLQYEVGDSVTGKILIDTSFVTPVELKNYLPHIGYGWHRVKMKIKGKTEFLDSIYVEIPVWESKAYEEKVEELVYIATPQERETLLTTKNRKKGWLEFWEKKSKEYMIDGKKLEQIYFTRISEAKRYFKEFTLEGWETDRGKVYVLLGPPDEREVKYLEVNSFPYEIWYYNSLRLKFIFIDKDGFGIYKLEYPKFWDEKFRIEE